MVRVKLPKLGAAVIRNTWCIRILFVPHHPLRDVFLTAVRPGFPRTIPECGPDTGTLSG
jgi:hypothetical protein